MKKSILLLFLLAFVVGAKAQTAEEIVRSAEKARGNISKMKSDPYLMEFSIKTQGMEMNMNMTMVNESKMRIDVTNPMANVSVAINGNSGWMSTNGAVQDIPAEQLEMMKNQYAENGASSDYELFTYKEKGKELSIIGSEMLENGDCWIIGLADKGKKPIKFWINKESMLTEKMIARSAMLGQEMEMEISFGDYKKFEDFLMPTAMAINVMGTVADMRIKSFKKLKNVDESIFARPSSATPAAPKE